jgi:hypothetical protein
MALLDKDVNGEELEAELTQVGNDLVLHTKAP